MSDLADARAYAAYLRARDAVAHIKSHTAAVRGGVAIPSTYWLEELENIDYMIDASPLIVRKLRQHAFHITGLRPYDYRDKGDSRRQIFEQRLRALQALDGGALLVPEAPALGGFGYEIDGQLFNVDTIKFYEALIGMERGGVLAAMRAIERPLICEVGAGWGGFAYQLRTLLPTAAYVIVDFPELFLFSATYLGAMFPEARLLFYDGDSATPLDGWRDADFIFIPSTAVNIVSTLPLDLLVNMVSFQEMTTAQVRAYASLAVAAGCPLLYSLNRERSPYNTELVSVSEVLADYYQLTEIGVLETDYTSAMKKPPKSARMVERTEFTYRHLVGRQSGARRGVVGRAGQANALQRPPAPDDRPRVVLGMPLYNNAANLPAALDSLLAQSHSNFILVMLDDASSDATESVARDYVRRDPRLRYHRHEQRRAMIATWREVAEIAARECPSAEYFAWVSDHDLWHPRWLETLLAELDGDPSAVLAYPVTRRISQTGEELEKGPRLFSTAEMADLHERWRAFCREGVGSGDMVYGLMRIRALEKAGVFRTVLRPDRLLIAELTLQGTFRQVPDVLWFRRQSSGTSVARQPTTLVMPGDAPRGFGSPPWLQHSLMFWREYAAAAEPPVRLPRGVWIRMLTLYQVQYGWRHLRKTETSHFFGSVIHAFEDANKLAKHYVRHGIYNTLVGARVLRGRLRRFGRRALYEALMLTHRLGLRNRGSAPR